MSLRHNFSIHILLVIGATFMLCIQCKFGSQRNVSVDNLGKEQISITIDGNQLQIPGDSLAEIRIAPGLHTIKFDNHETINIEIEKNYQYLLNPWNKTYYIQSIHFFMDGVDRYKVEPKTTFIEGYEMEGDFTKIENEWILKSNWQYGITDTIPHTVQRRLEPGSDGITTHYKLHSERDILRRASLERAHKKLIEKLGIQSE